MPGRRHTGPWSWGRAPTAGPGEARPRAPPGAGTPPFPPSRLWASAVLPTRSSPFGRGKGGRRPQTPPRRSPPAATWMMKPVEAAPPSSGRPAGVAGGGGVCGRRASRENLQTALHPQKFETCRPRLTRPPRVLSQTPTPARSARTEPDSGSRPAPPPAGRPARGTMGLVVHPVPTHAPAMPGGTTKPRGQRAAGAGARAVGVRAQGPGGADAGRRDAGADGGARERRAARALAGRPGGDGHGAGTPWARPPRPRWRRAPAPRPRVGGPVAGGWAPGPGARRVAIARPGWGAGARVPAGGCERRGF